MSNAWLLIAIPIGLYQIHKRRQLARALYRVAEAGFRAAEGLDVLRQACDSLTEVMASRERFTRSAQT